MTHPLDHMPDDLFPYVHGWNSHREVMIAYPHRGNGLHLKCLSCEREVWVGGRDIVVKHTAWLTRTVGEWAKGLRCQECGSRRVTVGPQNDPGAQGFFAGPHEKGPEVWDRRLSTWLAEVGGDIEDYRPALPV